MIVGWSGKLTRLVPLEIDRHFENALVWLNDPTVTEFVLVGDYPISSLFEREHFEKMMRGTETDVMFAVETLDGKHVGFSGIHQINYRHGTAVTGTILGDVESWGKGFGTDAALVRAAYAFDVIGLRMLLSSYLEGSERSRRMQLKVGYEICGVVPKKYWKRGQYRDENLTFLTRERWQAVKAGGS